MTQFIHVHEVSNKHSVNWYLRERVINPSFIAELEAIEPKQYADGVIGCTRIYLAPFQDVPHESRNVTDWTWMIVTETVHEIEGTDPLVEKERHERAYNDAMHQQGRSDAAAGVDVFGRKVKAG